MLHVSKDCFAWPLSVINIFVVKKLGCNKVVFLLRGYGSNFMMEYSFSYDLFLV